MYKRTKSVFAYWLILVSFGMASFAPLITHALSQSSVSVSIGSQICSAMGSASVQPTQSTQSTQYTQSTKYAKSTQAIAKQSILVSDFQQTQDEQSSTLMTESCPYCSFHMASIAIPENLSFARPQTFRLNPQLYRQSPKVSFVWRANQTRGPPIMFTNV